MSWRTRHLGDIWFTHTCKWMTYYRHFINGIHKCLLQPQSSPFWLCFAPAWAPNAFPLPLLPLKLFEFHPSFKNQLPPTGSLHPPCQLEITFFLPSSGSVCSPTTGTVFFLEEELIKDNTKSHAKAHKGRGTQNKEKDPERSWGRGEVGRTGSLKSSNGQFYSGHCIWARREGQKGKVISLAGPFVKLKFKHFP